MKKEKSKRDSELFHQYSINYCAGLLMQKLGSGFFGLDMIFSFLGIAPNHGSDHKWNRIMDRIGFAEHMVAQEVMEENRKLEVAMTIEYADTLIEAWLETEECKAASSEEVDAKCDSILKKEGNKIGITLTSDGAWQKRVIGRSNFSSKTGHNFGVGAHSNKILSVQPYSQACRICEYAEKNGKAIRDHRCPRNFSTEQSSKSMEPAGGVQHCVDIFNSDANCYVRCLVTDDDATTRANVKHSLHDIVEAQHPGSKVNGEIPPRRKRALGWPTDHNNKLK